MLNLTLDNKLPINILCLGAHCDDIEIGAGGTLLKLLAKYNINSVKWVVFTSNEVRKKEALCSAKQFLEGSKNNDIIIETFQDGYLPSQIEQIKPFFENLKTHYSPDIIFTHFSLDKHQDHRTINQLTWNTWRDHFILEYEIGKYDGDLGQPNIYVPLDREIVEKRNSIILKSFESQNAKHWFDDEGFKALLRLRGIESATYYAESFYAKKAII
jgi:LmbE family N-acetylglucosaminyl deacetylase